MMPMKYKLTICDDDPQQLSHLAAMVSTWSDTTGHPLRHSHVSLCRGVLELSSFIIPEF